MLRILFILAFLFIADLSAAAYVNITSLTTLTPSSSKGSLMSFDSVEAIKGFEASSSKDKLIVKESGIYSMSVSAQVGATASGASGYVDVWFAKNGKSIPNSTVRATLETSTTTYTLVGLAVYKFQAGDTIETWFSASGPSLGCIFVQPDNEPAMPSYQLVIIKIDEQ